MPAIARSAVLGATALALLSLLSLLGLLALPALPALAGSETPPAGPPWVMEFAEAQARALERGTPIFVYLTKTH